jgi:hypothetical protein
VLGREVALVEADVEKVNVSCGAIATLLEGE